MPVFLLMLMVDCMVDPPHAPHCPPRPVQPVSI
jgi:hypothetical protein